MKGGGGMKARKMLSVVLILAVLISLCVPAQADGELFFVAVNDTIPLTLTVFPTWSGGTLYVPYQVFDSQPCGVAPSYNQVKQTYVLLSRNRQMLFDLATGTVSYENGKSSSVTVLYKNGILYLPLNLCASHFGLKTTMLESKDGYQALRFTDGSEVYDDSLFIEKAENLIAYRVQQNKTDAQQPEAPSEPATPSTRPPQTTPTPEKTPATVYLAFTNSGSMRSSMDALKAYNLKGTFFLTEAELLDDPSLVFELLAAGHTIGLSVEEEETDIPAALRRANDALAALICQKSLLVLLPAQTQAPEEYCAFYRPAVPVTAAEAAESESAQLLICADDAANVLYTLRAAEAHILQLLETTEYA